MHSYHREDDPIGPLTSLSAFINTTSPSPSPFPGPSQLARFQTPPHLTMENRSSLINKTLKQHLTAPGAWDQFSVAQFDEWLACQPLTTKHPEDVQALHAQYLRQRRALMLQVDSMIDNDFNPKEVRGANFASGLARIFLFAFSLCPCCSLCRPTTSAK